MIKLNGLKDFLMKDFWWKLLSLVIAVSLWFIVINIENPVESRNFTVQVDIKNTDTIEDNNQVISNLSEILGTKITIKVRGQRLSLDRLYQYRDSIEAYIDVANIDWIPENGEVVSLPIIIKPPSNLTETYEIESRSIETILITIENIMSAEFPIELFFENGIPSNLSMSEPEITPGTVVVSGTQDIVNSVVGVRAVISVENITEDITYNAALIPYNQSGDSVMEVWLNHDFADIYIPVKTSKKVPLVVETVGTPMDGYVLESATAEPETIYVLGDEEYLSNIQEITLPAVNINGRNADLETSFVLKYVLPEGITLKAGEPERVVVKATFVAEEVKQVILKEENIKTNIDLADNLSADIMIEDITLQIKGWGETLSKITDDSITAELTVADLEVGEYRLPLSLTVPEGVTLTEAESPYVTVIITDTAENTETE